MLVCGSKLYSQTCDRIIVFDTTLPALRIRYSSSANSRGRRSSGGPAARDAARQQIEHEIVDRQRRRLGRARGAADQRLHAREQFGERERLGQVVVAAGLQAAHAIVDRAPRAQDQHRRRRRRGRRSSSITRQAVAPRQHHVDDRDVVGLRAAPRSSPLSPSAARSTAKPASRRPRATKSAIVSSSSTKSACTRWSLVIRSVRGPFLVLSASSDPGSCARTAELPTADYRSASRGGLSGGAARRYCVGHGTGAPELARRRAAASTDRAAARARAARSRPVRSRRCRPPAAAR